MGYEGVVQTGWQENVAVDHSGEARWRRNLHSRAGAATPTIGDIYVAANDLQEINPETGETNWQAHLPSEGTDAPVVTDDDVLVVAGDVRVFRRKPDGFLGQTVNIGGILPSTQLITHPRSLRPGERSPSAPLD